MDQPNRSATLEETRCINYLESPSVWRGFTVNSIDGLGSMGHVLTGRYIDEWGGGGVGSRDDFNSNRFFLYLENNCEVLG